MEVLNAYLTAMSEAILDHGGTVVSFMGDGIFAVFGAPVEQTDHARRAVAAAQEMVARLATFNEWLRSEKLGDGFEMGIGVNTGTVMAGNVGSERRLEYAAIGDTTNIAARLEQMTKRERHQLLIADSTVDALRAAGNGADTSTAASLEYLGKRDVRGRSYAIGVWSHAGSARPANRATR